MAALLLYEHRNFTNVEFRFLLTMRTENLTPDNFFRDNSLGRIA